MEEKMNQADRTKWFHDAKWGVFMHFLGQPPGGGSSSGKETRNMDGDEWNDKVDSFDVAKLAGQLNEVGAGYFIITIGQGSGHYCAPNTVYDEIVGIEPSKCSKRDLISDLHAALEPYGISLMVYTPSEGPFHDYPAREKLKMFKHWSDPDHDENTDWSRYRQVEFMLNWERILTHWSKQWGNKVRGWWVDGCYHKNERFPEDEPPNLATLADTLRSGNPNAIIAFNPGVKVPVIAYSEHEDYTAGEISNAFPVADNYAKTQPERFLDGKQYHVLSFIGKGWCAGPPRFDGDFAAGYTKYVNSFGGVISWDVPYKENGLIPKEFMTVLRKIGNAAS
jgi:alpha-L-fucosidase